MSNNDTDHPKITILDVASKTGVSVSTVSRVLSNPSYPVARATREKVLQAVEELGYKPSPGSQQNRTASREIGVILPNITNPFYSTALMGIEKECLQNGYDILLYNSFRDPEHEQNLLASLAKRGVEGVIISSMQQDGAGLKDFASQGMKMVLLDQKIEGIECHISFEYREGASNAVTYLHGLGHRDIYLATTPLTRWTRREIFEGYKRGLARAGIEYKEDMLISDEKEGETDEEHIYEHECGKRLAQKLLERSRKPTAVLCVNDMVAFGLIQELHANHVRVPGDISVIGFDDISFAAMFSPALTTVRCPIMEIGRLAAQFLHQQLTRTGGFSLGVKLEAMLVTRDSTGPVPGVENPVGLA